MTTKISAATLMTSMLGKFGTTMVASGGNVGLATAAAGAGMAESYATQKAQAGQRVVANVTSLAQAAYHHDSSYLGEVATTTRDGIQTNLTTGLGHLQDIGTALADVQSDKYTANQAQRYEQEKIRAEQEHRRQLGQLTGKQKHEKEMADLKRKHAEELAAASSS